MIESLSSHLIERRICIIIPICCIRPAFERGLVIAALGREAHAFEQAVHAAELGIKHSEELVFLLRRANVRALQLIPRCLYIASDIRPPRHELVRAYEIRMRIQISLDVACQRSNLLVL